MSDLSVNEVLNLIKKKENEIQFLLAILENHDGEAAKTSKQYFKTAVLWASIAAKI
jgi:hypothetical protein